MKLRAAVVIAALGIMAIAADAQEPRSSRPRALLGPQDPGYPDLMAKCRVPPPAEGGAPGIPEPDEEPASVAGKPGPAVRGVIAADQQWKLIWRTGGNNADGILASDDGGLLVAQADNGAVIKIDGRGRTSVLYRDTNAGGALSMSASGVLFLAERGLNSAIRELAPQHRIHVNSQRGDPLECLGGVLNDIVADRKGGVYFTMNSNAERRPWQGGLYYADARGVVSRQATNLRTNGIILSPDERTLYGTSGPTVTAFRVNEDGTLANQRTFATLPFGSGDGSTVDAAGRLYVTGGPAVHVIASGGAYLGYIPAPRDLTTVAFSGSQKRTLYVVGAVRNGATRSAEIYAISMLAQGFQGRAK